jgi:hypothetical protein
MMTTGECLCGSVTWSVEGEPVLQAFCHCNSCQKANSAALVAVALFPAESVSVVGDLDSRSVTDVENAAVRYSCAKCGTRVMNTPGRGYSQMRAVYPVMCKTHSWFQPSMHIFYEDRVVEIGDALPKFLDLPSEFGGSGKTV